MRVERAGVVAIGIELHALDAFANVAGVIQGEKSADIIGADEKDKSASFTACRGAVIEHRRFKRGGGVKELRAVGGGVVGNKARDGVRGHVGGKVEPRGEIRGSADNVLEIGLALVV